MSELADIPGITPDIDFVPLSYWQWVQGHAKEKGMIRDVHIHPVLNGWIVKVGCQRVVFTKKSDLLTTLSRYLDNPSTVEKEFLEMSVNAKILGSPEQAEGPGLARADIEFQDEPERSV